MLHSLTFAALSILAVLILGWAVQAFRNILSSPLRHVPGPWWAGLTGFPVKSAILSKRQVHFFHALHQKYGSFVRIAPDQIIVSDVEAFKEIHRIGTPFVKSQFYTHLNPTEPGKPPFALFAQTDPREHATRRKLLARGFTQAALRETWEDVVREKVAFAVQCIKSDAIKNGEADLLRWWTRMAADVISQLMFGESFNTLKNDQETAWFFAFAKGTGMNAMAWHFPWLYALLKLLPFEELQRQIYASRLLYDQGRAAVVNSRGGGQQQNLFAKVMAQAEKNEGNLTDDEIFVEAGSFCIAGTDTTANTMTYLIWAVLSNPPLQETLQKEVKHLKMPLRDADLENLEVLNAVIKECLRLYGAAPGGLPRVAPAGGTTLGRYFIPEGTTVSTQAWTLHRDASTFDDPERFDHTRWLVTAPPMSDRAKAAFSPFGAGSRVCVGMSLAFMELRLATAMFFRECSEARLAPSVTDESMAVENIFLISPKGGECKIVLPK